MKNPFLPVALLAALSILAVARGAVPQKGYGIEVAGVPEGAKIVLESSKTEYFLGENILVQFGVQNTSGKPFKLETGGDYRGSTRALRFLVTAVDADGKETADPDPSGFNMGGLSGPSEVKPGETFWEGVPLIRYRKFDKAGEYTITIRHDLGWGVPPADIPAGTIHLKLTMPNADQAAKVAAAMVALNADKNTLNGSKGRKRPDYPDFGAMRYPIYLPILEAEAEAGEKDACLGIGAIETPEATASLVKLLQIKKEEIVLAAARSLTMRLPDPDFDGKGPRRGAPFSDPRLDQRRALAAASWRAEFAPPVRAAARSFLQQDELHSDIGAFMLECVGAPDDLAFATAALEKAILASKDRTWKESDFPQPPANASGLERAVGQIVARGGAVPAKPHGPGEQAVLALAVHNDASFRPQGWEDVYRAMLASSVPYQRQEALMLAPSPDPFLDAIAHALNDPDLGVVCMALDQVARSKAARFAPAVERIMKTDRREWVLRYSDSAVFALGLTGASYATWIERMTEPGMDQMSMTHMVSLIEGEGGWGWNSNVPSDMASAQRAWRAFYAAHEEEIRAGKKFPVGKDGGITESMIPLGMDVQVDGKSWPARGK